MNRLDPATFERVLTRALAAGDYADAFYERRVARSFRLQNGHIHEAGLTVSEGVGIRVLRGEQAGYAYTDDLADEALLETARVASLVARNGPAGERRIVVAAQRAAPPVYLDVTNSPLPHDPADYVSLLVRADTAARRFDAKVRDVNVFVSEELQEVAIATSEGLLVTDRRPLVSFGVQCIAQGAARGSGFHGDGGRRGLGYFAERTPEDIACESARIATVNCDAAEAPAGDMPVVVGAGSGGVLLHEAVGHGLEGDFNRQGASLYSGRVGERVASDLVTIYDDGNLVGERGTVAVDDEGTPGRHNVLVERGVLRGYLQDRQNAALMRTDPTGNGRRQSFRVMPQPRMCNTYMPSGSATFEEVVGSVQRGLYAKSFAGGQVEISKGDFVFMLAEGYLIEDGRITRPVRGATLVGNGPDVMTRVVAVANDGHLAARYYTCGKGGQFVPVGVGMPTVKVASVTVGGSSIG